MLQAPSSKQILQKVADDTSTLRASVSATASQGGPPSIVSHDDSTIDSKIFDWDNEIVNADIYRRAMHHAIAKAENPTAASAEREERHDIASQAGTEESADRVSQLDSPIVHHHQKLLPYEMLVASEPLFGQQDQIAVPNSSQSDRPASRRSLLVYRQKSSDTGRKSFWSNLSGKRSSRNLATPDGNATLHSSGSKSSLASRRGRRGFENSYHTSIDFGSEDGLSAPAIVRAAQAGSVIEVETLLDQRADINARHIQSGRSALAVAAHCGNEGVVRLLLQHRAVVDERDVSLLAPLHLASMRGHVDVIKLLLQEQADVDVKGPNEQTPLRIATEKGETEVAEVLLRRRAKVNARDAKQMTPLHIAAQQGDELMTELLINNGAYTEAKDGFFMGPLHYACEGGHTGVMSLLLNKKANLEAPGKASMTPLLCASSSGQVSAVDLLIKKKASVKHKGEGEMTALHWASFNGHVEVVDLLIEKKVPIAAQNKDGRTPLHLAVMAEQFAVADLLLRKGAPIEAQCRSTSRPLHYACLRASPEITQLLLGYNAFIEAETTGRTRPIHIACTRGSLAHIELLIRKGAYVDLRNANGNRALGIASSMGHIDIVRMLLDRGAALRLKFGTGPSHEDSPLCLAAKHGHTAVVLELISRGASVLQKDERDWQPLRYAAFHAHPEVVDVLLKHGASVTGSASGGWGFNITAQRIGFASDVTNQEQRKSEVLRLLTAAEAREQRARANSTPSGTPYVPPAVQNQDMPMELPGPSTLASPPLQPPRPPPQPQQSSSTQELPVSSPAGNYTYNSIPPPAIAIPAPIPSTHQPSQHYYPPYHPTQQQNGSSANPPNSPQAVTYVPHLDQGYLQQGYPNNLPTPLPQANPPQLPISTPYTFVPKTMPQPGPQNPYYPQQQQYQYAGAPTYGPPANTHPGQTMMLGPDGLWRQNAAPNVQRAPFQNGNQNSTSPVTYPTGVYEMAS